MTARAIVVIRCRDSAFHFGAAVVEVDVPIRAVPQAERSVWGLVGRNGQPRQAGEVPDSRV